MKLEIHEFRIAAIERELQEYDAKYNFSQNENAETPTTEQRQNYLLNLLWMVRLSIGTPQAYSVTAHARELVQAIELGKPFEVVRYHTREAYFESHPVVLTQDDEIVSVAPREDTNA